MRRPLHVTILVVATALVAGGCGGGDAAATDPAAGGATPTPDPAAGGATVGATDPALAGTGAIDPATGQPIDPTAGSAGATATVPELVGDDVTGGLDPIGGDASPLFDALAVDDDKIKEQDEQQAEEDTEDTPAETTASTPAVSYTGAKIYVDGIVHTVDVNGSFPKAAPVFKLLSVTANDVEIELVAGEFTSSGGNGTYLDKGDLVSLINASEQVTYRVKYLRPITSTSDISF